jgi:hypothetical protein
MQSQSQQFTGGPSTSELGIENTNIKTATGVELNDQQKVIVGSVLDVSASELHYAPTLTEFSSSRDDLH